jgi:HEAT repeat protein
MLSWLEMEENREALAELETLHASIYDIRFSIWMRAAELASGLKSGSALDAIVEEASRTYELKEDGRNWLREQLTNGHGRIVLDALDEVPISDRRELDQAIGQLPTTTRLLMTSRLVGYTKAPAGVPPENELEVLAFGDREMQQAIRRWFDVERDAAALWDHIREHWMIREILHCPLLLRLACAAADKLRQERRKLPRWETRAELYETFLDQSINRMVEKAGLRSTEYAAVEQDIRVRSADDPMIPILKKVLTQMQAGSEVRASMRDFAADLSLALWRLDARRTFWEEQADLRKAVAQAAAPYRVLATRADLLEDLKAADILTAATSEKEGDPALMYTHRTIGEYLTARSLSVKLKSSSEAVEWKFVDKKAWDPYWKPVLLFLAGQLSNDLQTLNRYIALLSRPETDPYEDDLFRHRLCLAVEALAEVPAAVRPALDGQVDQATKALYELYWRALSEDALGALPHSAAAWRSAGRLNGFVDKLRLIPHLVECLLNVDPGTRMLAAQALAEMGEVAARDDRVIPTLVDRVSDENRGARQNAAWALGRMREAAWQHNEVPKTLTERLQNENHEVRLSAAQALGEMGEYAAPADQVIAALMERLWDEKASVRENAALALGQMKETIAQDERVMAALIELLENDAFEVRESAGTVLGNLGEAAASNKRVMAALADQLGNENWQVRQNAAWTIGRMGEPAARDERVIRTLVEWLAAEGWLERRTAASVLGGMGEVAARNDQVIASLTAQLGDENWQVRLNSAWALGRMGETIAQNPKVMSALLQRLSDEHSQVRLNAARAFGRMGEAAARNESVRSALLEGLDDSAWQVCYRSALALARMGRTASGDGRVRAALVRGLRSKKATDRRIAAQALGEMGKAVAHDHSVIAALIERLDDESWEVRDNAAHALGEMGEAAARDERVIPTLLKWREHGVISAASVLGMFFRTGARVFPAVHPQTSVATRWVDELARCDD